MTSVTFHTGGGRLTGFTCQGHSGYADAGTDIVCAAVTSAVRLTECAINDIMGLSAPVKVQEDNAVITLRLPNGLNESAEETCQTLLTALMVHLEQLHEEYPAFLEVYEQS